MSFLVQNTKNQVILFSFQKTSPTQTYHFLTISIMGVILRCTDYTLLVAIKIQILVFFLYSPSSSITFGILLAIIFDHCIQALKALAQWVFGTSAHCQIPARWCRGGCLGCLLKFLICKPATYLFMAMKFSCSSKALTIMSTESMQLGFKYP